MHINSFSKSFCYTLIQVNSAKQKGKTRKIFIGNLKYERNVDTHKKIIIRPHKKVGYCYFLNFLHNFSVPYSTFFLHSLNTKKNYERLPFSSQIIFCFCLFTDVRLYRAVRQYNECAINVLVVPSHKFNCTRKIKVSYTKKVEREKVFVKLDVARDVLYQKMLTDIKTFEKALFPLKCSSFMFQERVQYVFSAKKESYIQHFCFVCKVKYKMK